LLHRGLNAIAYYHYQCKPHSKYDVILMWKMNCICVWEDWSTMLLKEDKLIIILQLINFHYREIFLLWQM